MESFICIYLYVVIFILNENKLLGHASKLSNTNDTISRNVFYLNQINQHQTENFNTQHNYAYNNVSNRAGGRTNMHMRNGSSSSTYSVVHNKWTMNNRIGSTDGGRLIRTRGDIILGGIFPMHEHNINNPEYPCGDVKEEKGIQRLEAMMYALDMINTNHIDLLPNITLGSLVIDSCSSDTYALEQSMEFVRYYMNQVLHCAQTFFYFIYIISQIICSML